MKNKEATEILKAIGWHTSKDEIGDRVAQFTLPDRIVDIIYGVSRATKYQQFSSSLSVSTEVFSLVYSRIGNERYSYAHLIAAWKGLDIRDTEMIRPEHIHQASQQAIEWAKEQDLHKALLEHAALPTSAPGTGPVLHLSALALLGEIEKLKSYQASFEAGDRLGFVPYITKDFIDRAVTIAEQNSSQLMNNQNTEL